MSVLTEEDIKKAEAEINRKPNKELLDHEKKRRVELKCLELNDLMEDQGYKQDEIDEKVNEYRTLLLDQVVKGEFELDLDRNGRPIANDSHTRAEIMAERKSRMRSALGIKDDFVEGSCLDQLKPKTEIAKAEIVKEEKPDDKKKWDERYEHDNRAKPVDSATAEVAEKRLQLIDKVEKTTEKKTIKKEGDRKKEKMPPKKRARHASTSSDDSSGSSSSTDSDSSDSSESSSSSDDDRKKKKHSKTDAKKKTTTNKAQQRRESSPSHKDRRRITSSSDGSHSPSPQPRIRSTVTIVNKPPLDASTHQRSSSNTDH